VAKETDGQKPEGERTCMGKKLSITQAVTHHLTFYRGKEGYTENGEEETTNSF